MAVRICVYEDSKYRQFYPLSYLRPVYSMRGGIQPPFMNVPNHFETEEIWLAARNSVAALVTAEHRGFPVNFVKREENDSMLFINGRIRDYGDLPRLVAESRLSTVFKNGKDTIGVLFHKDTISGIPLVSSPVDYVAAFHKEREEIPDFDTKATLYHYNWEIMGDIEQRINEDFARLRPSLAQSDWSTVPEGVFTINRDYIHLGSNVKIMPGSVIDASGGPVFIGDNAKVESQAAVYGPCYIGPNSVVVAGKVSSSSIGHTCRVGGEVEESVFHSYVNKYHAGFIGHSYVGSWVNFGAMTTNSDLKNNYSGIRVTLNGDLIDTGSIKVGSFIGDHTKFGIGTLLTTGINIGVCCNIFGGTLITDKEVPSFSWGDSSGYQKYDVDKAVATANVTVGRRDVELSDQEESLLRKIADDSTEDEGVIDF